LDRYSFFARSALAHGTNPKKKMMKRNAGENQEKEEREERK
jgi:hypothetical protein